MNPENTNENEKDASGSSSSISSDLIRGHINTIILRTLYDGDKYGYEIINEIEEKSKGQYTLKQPTLYSALKRLESQDFLTSYWGGVSNGGRRKYFQITDKGRKVVEQNLAEWEYSRTVIDSLISERDYDFSNPPPAASVDFNILKKSTTRVPVGKGEDEDFIELGEGEYGEASESSEEAAPVTAAAPNRLNPHNPLPPKNPALRNQYRRRKQKQRRQRPPPKLLRSKRNRRNPPLLPKRRAKRSKLTPRSLPPIRAYRGRSPNRRSLRRKKRRFPKKKNSASMKTIKF